MADYFLSFKEKPGAEEHAGGGSMDHFDLDNSIDALLRLFPQAEFTIKVDA